MKVGKTVGGIFELCCATVPYLVASSIKAIQIKWFIYIIYLLIKISNCHYICNVHRWDVNIYAIAFYNLKCDVT